MGKIAVLKQKIKPMKNITSRILFVLLTLGLGHWASGQCADTLTFTKTNVSCYGQSNGSTTVTVKGATTPISYLWSTSPAQYTARASGLAAGTYTVTIVDANGCSASSSVIITSPAVLISNPVVTDVTCNGLSTGKILAGATGGTTNYTYSWSDGKTTATASTLSVGTYTVTVTDAKGCSTTASATVSQPSALSIGTSSTQANCSATGTAALTPSGGTTPYTYSWSSGQTSSSISSAYAGTYTVTVTDAFSCSSTSTLTVGNGATAPGFKTVTITQPSACGGTGQVAITISAGTKNYTYSWSDGTTNGVSPAKSTLTYTITGLSGGDYQITVTDSKGCQALATALLTTPATLTPKTVVTNVTCFGLNNGKIVASRTGGTTAFTYSWSNGGTTATISNLAPGTYTVTINDANNCTASTSATVAQPSAALGNSFTLTEPSCFGLNNGSASANVTGGTAPYTYSWSGGVKPTSDTITNLASTTYYLTITDAKGCTFSNSTLLNQPVALTVMPVTGSSDCSNASGTGNVIVNGGTSPYNYSWGNGASTSSITGIGAGLYSVTVTDANGCSMAAVDTILNSSGLVAQIAILKNVACNGDSTGQLAVNVTGGAAPYSYNWSTTPTQGTDTISHLYAGNYAVTVTDLNGCNVVSTVLLTQPNLISGVFSSTGVSCYGLSNGQDSVTVSNGIAPFTYAWSGNPSTSASGATATNLAAGTYTVTVTDNHGCSVALTSTVAQPALLTATTARVNPICNLGSNGIADVIPSGGTTTYTYAWSTSPVQTTAAARGLNAGIYTVTVTDKQGCTLIAVDTLLTPAVFITHTTPALCNNSATGSISAAITGGYAPYTYSWSNDSTYKNSVASNSLNGVVAGTYSLTVTDGNGCSVSTTAIISEPNVLTINLQPNTIACFGLNTGAISAVATGGTSPYNYSWSGGSATAGYDTLLTAGTYSLSVTDANGCSVVASTSVNQPNAALSASIAPKNITCYGLNNGVLTASVMGGTQPYNYAWSSGSSVTAADSNLAPGAYNLTVTDANGCMAAVMDTMISQPTLLQASAAANSIACYGIATGAISASAMGGVAPYNYAWNAGSGVGAYDTLLVAGSYSVTISDANGCSVVASATINQPNAALMATVLPTEVTCYGYNNGALNASVAGGTMPYNYFWSDGSSGAASDSNLVAGSYNLTVTDANGCMAVVMDTMISQPALLQAAASANSIACYGLAIGAISASAMGGVAPYNYAWNDGSGVGTYDTLLVAGSYSVTISDANGCSVVASATINQTSSAISASVLATSVTCYGYNNGALNASVVGGTQPYNYSWSDGSSGAASDSNLVAGNYNLTITDANGCNTSTSATITQPNALHVTKLTGFNSAYPGGAILVVSGGTMPYLYSWSTNPVQTTDTVLNLTPGVIYNWAVIDSNNCIVADTIMIYDITTGLSTTGNNSGTVSLNAYPNPSANHLTISANLSGAQAFEIRVVDATGKIVFTESQLNLSSYNKTIDVNGLSNGMYTLQVVTGDRIYSKRVVVQK